MCLNDWRVPDSLRGVEGVSRRKCFEKVMNYRNRICPNGLDDYPLRMGDECERCVKRRDLFDL
jgi:hypothetical protein